MCKQWLVRVATRIRGQRDAVWTLIANLVISATSLATTVVAARILGPVGRGQLGAIRTWPVVLAGLAMFGMQDAVVYYGAQSRDDIGRYSLTAATFILLVGAPFMGLAWLAMPWLFRAEGALIVAGARWYLLVWLILVLHGVPLFAARAAERFGLWNLLRVCPVVLWLGVLVAVGASGKASAVVVAKAYLMVLGAFAIVTLPAIGRYVSMRAKPTLATSRRMLRFALPAQMSTLPRLIGDKVDQLLVVSLLPAESVGYYAVAMAWASSLGLASSAVTSLVFPKVAGMKDRKAQKAYVRRCVLAVLMLSVSFGGGLAILAPWVIPALFGRAFAPAIPLAEVLLVAAGIQGEVDVYQAAMKGIGKPAAVFRVRAIGLVLTIPILLLALSHYGTLGAAAAVVAAQCGLAWLFVRVWAKGSCEVTHVA